MGNYDYLRTSVVDMVSVLEEHLDNHTYEEFDKAGAEIIQKLVKLEEIEKIISESQHKMENTRQSCFSARVEGYLAIEKVIKNNDLAH